MSQEPPKEIPGEPPKENPEPPPKAHPPKQPRSIRQRLTTAIEHDATKHIALAVVLVLMSVLVVRISAHWAREKGQDLFSHLRHGELLTTEQKGSGDASTAVTVPAAALELHWPKTHTATIEERARLEGQLEEVRQRARFHLRTMLFMFEHYYATVVAFSLSGAVAAIMLVLISKKGWNKANRFIITVFFVMTAATVLYGAFPELFRTQQGIDESKLLYSRYVALEDEILSYAATGMSPPVARPGTKGQEEGGKLVQGAPVGGAGNGETAPGAKRPCDASSSQEPRCFILHVDEELARGGIPIGLDYTKAPRWTNAFEFGQGAGGRVPVGEGSTSGP